MSTAPKRRLLSEPEYLLIERQAAERSEYVRGEMFAMAGASREHNVIASNISRRLGNQLENRGCDVYQSDMKVWIPSKRRYAYPDVVVVCGHRKFADEHRDVLINPTVLIEVLSESTRDYDLAEKASDYRSIESLREIVLIAQDQPWAEHLVRGADETWSLRDIVGADANVSLRSIGCELPFAAVYAKIEFPGPPRPLLRVAADESV